MADFCQLLLIFVCASGIRDERLTSDEANGKERAWRDDGPTLSEPRCLMTTSESRDEVQSLTLAPVNFHFFRSREFFLAEDCASGPSALKMQLKGVPISSEDRRMLLEERFKVKMLKDGVQAGLARDGGKLKRMKDMLTRNVGQEEYVPAVEFHMFPTHPRNATSDWMALLVPTVPEVFGKKLYLCGYEPTMQHQCISELWFQPPPWRLQRWFKWDFLDRLRSAPFRLLQLAEGLLLLSFAMLAAAGVCAVMYSRSPADEVQLKMPELPAKYQLLQHAQLYQEAGGVEKLECELDAGMQVTVQDVSSAVKHISPFWPMGWPEILHRTLFGASDATWGHLAKPRGWILLHEVGGDILVSAETEAVPSFHAHPQLLPTFPLMIKENLILLAAYLSAQWLCLERLSALYGHATFAVLLLSLWIVHMLVLLQQVWSFNLGLQHEELLQERRRLRLMPQFTIAALLSVPVLGMAAALALRLEAALSQPPQLTAMFAMCVCIGLRVKHVYDMIMHIRWRDPCILSAEYFPYSLPPMPTTTDAPAKLSGDRAKKWLAAVSLKMLFAWIASAAMALALSDFLHLRGELLKYEVSRGHLTYPSNNEAVHNTLLLDSNADALTLGIELFDHTHGVQMKIESPLLNASDVIPFNKSGEHQLALPSGPFYSRITLIALGAHVHTNYTIHVLRVQPAITVSLSSSFPSKNPNLSAVVFHEERRLQYLQRHPEWPVPDLDMSVESTLQVTLRSLVMAPFSQAADMANVPVVSEQPCTDVCGEEIAGYGNGCIFEQVVNGQEEQTPLCVGQRAPQGLSLEGLTAADTSVLGKNSKLLTWLQDMAVSGKSVLLGGDKKVIDRMQPFEAVASDSTSLTNSFRLKIPLMHLVEGEHYLDIAATQDLTSAEHLSIPFVIMTHPPVLSLHVNCSDCFLLPGFDKQSLRKEYALCSRGVEAIKNVIASTDDSRFKVTAMEFPAGVSCLGHGKGKDIRKEFRAFRKDECAWCKYYQPWAEGYDVAVVHSTAMCLRLALGLKNVTLLKETIAPTINAGDRANKCVDEGGLLGDAVRRSEKLELVKVLLDSKSDPNAESEGETPMEIAAARGRVAALQLLLNSSARLDSALEAAASQCELAAMTFLVEQLQKRGEVTTSTCKDSPLGKTLLQQKYWPNCGSNGTRLGEVVRLLQQGTMYKSDDDDQCKGLMLNFAISMHDMGVVKFLLQGDGLHTGANANQKVGKSTPLRVLMAHWQSRPLSEFEAMARLLQDHKMDINLPVNKGMSALVQALLDCSYELVDILLQLGANPESKYRKTASEWAAKCDSVEPAAGGKFTKLLEKFKKKLEAKPKAA